MEQRNNKTTPRNPTNTERCYIEQITQQNSKEESYFSKKDFYAKFKPCQETVPCNKSAQDNEKQNSYASVVIF